jgi:hypothetical protein
MATSLVLLAMTDVGIRRGVITSKCEVIHTFVTLKLDGHASLAMTGVSLALLAMTLLIH